MPHSSEAMVKTVIDHRKKLRRPKWADSQPVIRRMKALAAK
jgi:hypothetical protein